ncbi:MAG: tRNA (adenosine(37)-N6)-threonylcarbamoyltransferase complex dimerization subunit type 1 TsaB [Ruminococcaceae bacterium]|nr:tRNA (adenosine(37)-N6)-threonylcarbamoyltransferase complex dimerization subunit type 1 TsaB [Oscillospiraceae bacterium]
MLTLALDSTANTASCALARDGRLLALYTVNGLLTHSETLLPMIENMLEKSAVSLADIDRFAVTDGPGSFTGVRIGVSLIKGLAFGQNKPCVGVSTLASLAKNLDGFSGFVVPVMDARRSQVYTAIFKDGERLTEDALIPLSELHEKLVSMGIGEIFLCGDGYDIAKKYFAETDITIRETPALLIPQNAFSTALIAETMTTVTDRELSAKYLRASQAERERLEREKGEK